MISQVTPEQVASLLTLSSLVLLLVTLRLVGLAIWNKWFKDDAELDSLTQEERDERLIRRAREREWLR